MKLPAREILILTGLVGVKMQNFKAAKNKWLINKSLIEDPNQIIDCDRPIVVEKVATKYVDGSPTVLVIEHFVIDFVRKIGLNEEAFSRRLQSFTNLLKQESNNYGVRRGTRWTYENKEEWFKEKTKIYGNSANKEIRLERDVKVSDLQALLSHYKVEDAVIRLKRDFEVTGKKEMFFTFVTESTRTEIPPEEGVWEELTEQWRYFLSVREFYKL